MLVQENLMNLRSSLSRLVENFEYLTAQFPSVLLQDKTRVLRCVVPLQPWADQALAQMTVADYNFHQFVTALYEGLTLPIWTRYRDYIAQWYPPTHAFNAHSGSTKVSWTIRPTAAQVKNHTQSGFRTH